MLVGLGVDILSLARLEAVIARRGAHRVAKRICSAGELVAFEKLERARRHARQHVSAGSLDAADATSPHAAAGTDADVKAAQLRFLAARWAAKEAAYKALRPWPRNWGWKNLEMAYDGRGAPVMLVVPRGGYAGAGAGVGAGSQARAPGGPQAPLTATATATAMTTTTTTTATTEAAGTDMESIYAAAPRPIPDNANTGLGFHTPPTPPADAGAADAAAHAHTSLLVSISHDAGVIVAAVVAQRLVPATAPATQ